jgi:hypothetical protein
MRLIDYLPKLNQVLRMFLNIYELISLQDVMFFIISLIISGVAVV